MQTNGQPDPLPNGGVDFYGRCLRCGQKVETSGGCQCCGFLHEARRILDVHSGRIDPTRTEDEIAIEHS